MPVLSLSCFVVFWNRTLVVPKLIIPLKLQHYLLGSFAVFEPSERNKPESIF